MSGAGFPGDFYISTHFRGHYITNPNKARKKGYSIELASVKLSPKDPFVCPNRKGLITPRTIPILFGWDWNPKNATLDREWSDGFLGIGKLAYLANG